MKRKLMKRSLFAVITIAVLFAIANYGYGAWVDYSKNAALEELELNISTTEKAVERVKVSFAKNDTAAKLLEQEIYDLAYRPRLLVLPVGNDELKSIIIAVNIKHVDAFIDVDPEKTTMDGLIKVLRKQQEDSKQMASLDLSTQIAYMKRLSTLYDERAVRMVKALNVNGD